MGAVVSDIVDHEDHDVERSGYFEASSTVNFVNQVLRIVSEHGDTGAKSLATRRSGTRPKGRQQALEEYALPPRREADAMLSGFWVNIHSLYPFLDRHEFERTYHGLWTAGPSDELTESHVYADSYGGRDEGRWGDRVPESRRFHILLNVMFALGCDSTVSESAAEESQRGEMHWKRCKDLLERDFDIFNRPRILIIQALLYMEYNRALERMLESCRCCCENVRSTGAALLPEASVGNGSDRYFSSVADLGWMCRVRPVSRAAAARMGVQSPNCSISMLATTYGRSSMVPAVTRQRIASCVPPSSDSSNDWKDAVFLIASLKLNSLLGDIIDSLPNSAATNTENGPAPHIGTGLLRTPQRRSNVEAHDFVALLNFEEALEGWDRDLPDILRLPATADLMLGNEMQQRSGWDRHAVVLRVR
ncbi:uncharacterized protein LTR77_005300 [Saxophila tyrrhenica]|uniref:Xylanolytic transcriptional activator regulatory domain-containing protein n=1 Tax=Saxophila tyrrhenica TaxID=1690608 RepID=A0AAV9PC97_9PEZI|nr:hypothetical protein LTR77_005300 [Saxophila tyrrhenica]